MPTKCKPKTDIESDDDSSSDYEEEPNLKLDNIEYTKFLNKLFPSNHIKRKLKTLKQQKNQ